MSHYKTLIVALLLTATARAGAPATDENWEYEGEHAIYVPHVGHPALGGLFSLSYGYACGDDEPLFSNEFWTKENISRYYGCSGSALEAMERLVRHSVYQNYPGYDGQSFESFKKEHKYIEAQALADLQLAWSCNTYQKAHQTAVNECESAAKQVQRKLRFARASGSGHGWVVETIATARPLGYYFFHGRPEVMARGTLYLDNCDNIPVAREVDPGQLSLPKLIANFEEIDFKNFWQCTLKVEPESIVLKQAIVRSGYGDDVGFEPLKDLTITVFPEGEIYLQSQGYNLGAPRAQYKPIQAKSVDEARRQTALNGAANFVNLLKEHGRLIARNGLAGASKGEIQRLAAESLAVRKAQMIRELAALNDNYSQLTLIDRLSVSASVERAYKYFQSIETRVAKLVTDQERLNLDKLVGAAAAKSSSVSPLGEK